MASSSVAMGKKAAASNVFRNNLAAHGPDKAFDDDPETRWATDAGTHEAWLEVDLGEAVTIDRAIIQEAYGKRVQSFELQHKRDGQWQTFARGQKIAEGLEVKFEPVAAQVVRLNILKASEGPTIWEFQLFRAKK
jgi:alpha-L-fucosidase